MMISPPTFQRAPRLAPELPHGEVEIPDPPSAPNPPSVSLFSVLLPGTFSLLFIVAIVLLNASQDQRYLYMSMLSGGFMLVTSMVSLQIYVSQRMNYRRNKREREQKYREMLQSRERELRGLREQQQQAARQTDPDLEECLARAERRDRRLWERSPGDQDFLSLRLGSGAAAFGVSVKAGRSRSVDTDPLLGSAQALADEFTRVPEVAISLPLGSVGMAGLVGPRSGVLKAARTIAVQIATHHSPDEVKLVAIYPPEERAEWAWLRWLPHVWSEDRRQRYLVHERAGAHDVLLGLYDQVNRRRYSGDRSAAGPKGPALVFFLADPALVEGEPILPLLVRSEPALHLYPLFLADRVQSLPPACTAIAEMGPGQPRLTRTDPVTSSIPFEPDLISTERADRFARGLAPLRLQHAAGSAQVPQTVSLLDLLGVQEVEQLEALRRWTSSNPGHSLAVPVGRRAGDDPLLVDLHERGHGPHGLAAGATGSGKSELLQSLITSLAVHFHPHELAFVLVDYKGGGMANAFADLPHLIGTITNLEGNLAMRSLAALKSELKRREAMLGEAGVNHIDPYQKLQREGKVSEPLPHLIMIVDEFAELKAEQPEFMRELVSAVRVGRSLGVHLLLATQKPAGVVDEQIWANSRFRLCLRVERTEDSQEVLKRPDAAGLTNAGRAYFQVGQNEVFELFQAAWGGAAYAPDGAVGPNPTEIAEVAFDGSRQGLRSITPVSSARKVEASGTQLQALVRYLDNVAETAGIERLPGPWLPPLPDEIMLDDVRPIEGWDGHRWQPVDRWLEPVVGLVDDPVAQHQGPLRLPLARDGHMAVYSAPGLGKTTFLQTLVTSLARSYSPEDVHLYLLDFGGRSLNLFAALPHVGAVILADESERLGRLLRHLTREMEVRRTRFAELGVNTLAAYRAAGAERLPAIVVVVDNYSAFSSTYDSMEDSVVAIAREGGSLGIHLLLTANNGGGIKSRVQSNIMGGVALHLAERVEYSGIVGRTEGLEPAAIPGRGLIKGTPPLEFQTALPIAGVTEVDRSAALRALVEEMNRAWTGPRPRQVRKLPDVVALCDLLPSRDEWPASAGAGLVAPVGLDVAEIEPFHVNLADGPHFVIGGPAQGGKSTLLQSWLLALADAYPPERLQLYLIEFQGESLRPLARLPQVRSYSADDEQLMAALDELTEALQARREALDEARQKAAEPLDEAAWIARQPAIVLALDPFDGYIDNAYESKERLEQLIRNGRGQGLYVLAAGPSRELSGYETLAKLLKEGLTGFVLGSSEFEDLQLLNLRLPYGESGKGMPPGQGFYSRRGQMRAVKAASAQQGDVTLATLIERISRRALRARDTTAAVEI